MADRIGQQLGSYRITRLLGSGGFAEVYLGEHIYLNSLAALKVLRTSLSDKDVQRFLAEAQTLVRLRHPHIVRVLEFAVEQGTPVLVMDYAPGGIIRETYPPGSPLPLKVVVAYVKQVASALQYAHNHNVIHRDVKPENILLGTEQELLLSDFGLSLLTPAPDLLSTQEMAGTIPYMAPEQLHGKPVFASDQYALGIVTYEWLCGTRPFAGTLWEIAHQHLSVAPPPLREKCPTLPVEVEDVVLKALAKEPRQRFVSVQAFAHALARASQASILEESAQASIFVSERSEASFATQPDQALRRIFLAASPADESFATRLKADLKVREMLLESTPSTFDREEEVRKAIRAAQFVVVVVSPHMRSSRTIKEYLRIASMYERQRVFVWAAGDDIATMLPEGWGKTAVLDLIDAREGRYELALDELVACLEAEEELSITAPLKPFLSEAGGKLPEPRNPYKGLRAFMQDDATNFFGRDALIQELMETTQSMLMPAQPGTAEARLLTVIGPSGSGKSSVVMAGLLPRLQHGTLPGSEKWVYLEPMVPGKHPIEALGLTLAPHFSGRSFVSIREDLEDDSTRGLHVLASQLVTQQGTQVVLLVDQFEELFTQTDAEEERRRFIELLLTATTEPRGPLLVVLTLRADFYDRPMQYSELHRLMQQHLVEVLPMEVEDLRATIEQPAALPDVQLTFEGNLVGDLLFEAQGQVGALPLLEFTLDQLFQQRNSHQLTLDAYQKIGGVKGALAKHAEATYTSLPSEEHRRLARALFLRLIDPGATEQDTTRRRAALSELSLPDAKQTITIKEATDAFIAARLLTTNEIAGTTTVEVSHEALIREWKRLADWLAEAREDIHLQQAISEDVAEWERRGKPRDRLYRETELAEAQAWMKRNVPSSQEVDFLLASATRERKVRRQRRFLIGITSVVLVGLLVVALVLQSNLLQSLPVSVTNLNDHGPGSLRDAIARANDGNAISFASTLQGGTITLTSGELEITKNLAISGRSRAFISISGGNKSRVFHIDPGVSVTISNLMIKNGSDSQGGGIENEGTLVLINSIISGNTVRQLGGGILNMGKTLSIEAGAGLTCSSSISSTPESRPTPSCTPSTETKLVGASIGEGILTLSHCIVSGNMAREGGGIFNDGGALNIIDSTVFSNTVGDGGGGIENFGPLTLTNSTISGNIADMNGGGILDSDISPNGMLTLTNSTISDNRANDGGGGIFTSGDKNVSIAFSTIYGNTAKVGGGIFNTNMPSSTILIVMSESRASVSATIIAGDAAESSPDVSGTFTLLYPNLIQNISGATILFGTDPYDPAAHDLAKHSIFGKSPNVGPLRDNGGPTQTRALLPGSPAIDQIPSTTDSVLIGICRSGVCGTDQRGVPRPQTGSDIGAYEYQPS